jgi:AcrR family transcriptional regulator
MAQRALDRPPSRRAAELLAIANEFVRTEGPHSLSLRRIAQLAGTSTQSVYTEFGGKGGLADAVFRSGFEQLAAELTVASLPDNPIARIRTLASVYRRVAINNPAHYQLMTGAPIAEYRPSEQSLRYAASTMEPLRIAVRDAIDEGLLHGSPDEVAEDLWAIGHGYVSLEISGFIAQDDDRFHRYLDAQLSQRR